MPTSNHDKQFSQLMVDQLEVTISQTALDSAIEWISDNLEPQDVFGDKDLIALAEGNGYVK